MEKITFAEFCNEMRRHNNEQKHIPHYERKSKVGYIVFSEDSFTKVYSLESRTYGVSSDNKYFMDDMGGNSLFGGSLDNTDRCVRLDWYIRTSWKIDYCYFK